MAAKLSAIAWWDRAFVVPDFLEPLVRRAVEKKFEAIPEDIRQTALARIGGAEVRASAPPPA